MEQYVEVSIKEYAAMKHISEYTVRTLIKNGQLPATKYGRIYRINVAAVPVEPVQKYPVVFKSEQEFCAMLDAIPIY